MSRTIHLETVPAWMFTVVWMLGCVDTWMLGFHLHSGDRCSYSSYGVNRDILCGTNACLFVCLFVGINPEKLYFPPELGEK